MITVSEHIYIHDSKIKYYPIKSSGSGGQRINKVSTAILLKYEIQDQDYPKWFLKNLKEKFGNRISKQNILIIKSSSSRYQKINKKSCLKKLIEIFQTSSKKLKQRGKTKVPFNSKIKRLKDKKHTSKKKTLRMIPKTGD